MSSFGDGTPRTQIEQCIKEVQETHALSDRELVICLVDVLRYIMTYSDEFPRLD